VSAHRLVPLRRNVRHYSFSSIHWSIFEAVMMRRLGWWGLSVPAVTLNPPNNIAVANCLASLSVENDFVFLGTGARDSLSRRSLGPSTETYQRLVIFVYLATTAAMNFKTHKEYHERIVSAVIHIKGCLQAVQFYPRNIVQDQFA
jgi:hypothetical protein